MRCGLNAPYKSTTEEFHARNQLAGEPAGVTKHLHLKFELYRMPEILASWQQPPQDFTSRPSACSASTASTAMIAPQANGASANAALDEQGHEYKTVRIEIMIIIITTIIFCMLHCTRDILNLIIYFAGPAKNLH